MQGKLDLDSRVESILEDTPLSGHSNIRDCEAAAQTLQEALRQELNPGISILQAVSEQKELFTKLSATFGRRLHEHLSTQFVQNVSCSGLFYEIAPHAHTYMYISVNADAGECAGASHEWSIYCQSQPAAHRPSHLLHLNQVA